MSITSDEQQQNIDKTTHLNAQAFIESFASNLNDMALAITYLANVASFGNDKAYASNEKDPERLSKFRKAAYELALISEDGSAHEGTKIALTNFLAQDPLYATELDAVKKPPRPEASPASLTRVNASPAEGFGRVSVGAGIWQDKADAIERGDVDALRMMAENGLKFHWTDLMHAVNHRDTQLREPLIRLVCEHGVALPDWMRSAVQDPALLAIIDAYPGQQEGASRPR